MAKTRRFLGVPLLAFAASACIALPASAAVTFQYGDASSNFMIEGFQFGGFNVLQPVTNGDNFYQYYITCYDNCDGLPYGGSVMSVNWNTNFSNHTLDYNFNAFEGTDDSLVSTDLGLYFLFHTDKAPTFLSYQKTSNTPPGPGCVGCTGPFSWSAGSDVDPGGGYQAWVFINSGASLSYWGTNNVSHQLHLVIAEVPEPATWGLMLAGFAGLGAALRMRRRALIAAAQ